MADRVITLYEIQKLFVLLEKAANTGRGELKTTRVLEKVASLESLRLILNVSSGEPHTLFMKMWIYDLRRRSQVKSLIDAFATIVADRFRSPGMFLPALNFSRAAEAVRRFRNLIVFRTLPPPPPMTFGIETAAGGTRVEIVGASTALTHAQAGVFQL